MRKKDKLKKEEIIEKAREIFSRTPFEGVSMNEIARSLGVTKPALYYHFKSKEEIYKKAIEESILKFKKTISKITEEKKPERMLEEIIERYFSFVLKEKNFIRILFYNFSSPSKKIKKYLKSSRQEFLKEIEKKLKEASFSQNALFLISLINNLALLKNSFSHSEKKKICYQIKNFLLKI